MYVHLCFLFPKIRIGQKGSLVRPPDPSTSRGCVSIPWRHASALGSLTVSCVLLQQELPDLSLSRFQPVSTPEGSDLVAAYDEHVLVKEFKFGVIYQRPRQTTEEEIFSNRTHSPAFDEFLHLLGRRIRLREHRG